jgi:hypothetical protein
MQYRHKNEYNGKVLMLKEPQGHSTEIEKNFTGRYGQETHGMAVADDTGLKSVKQRIGEMTLYTVSEIAHIEYGRHQTPGPTVVSGL